MPWVGQMVIAGALGAALLGIGAVAGNPLDASASSRSSGTLATAARTA